MKSDKDTHGFIPLSLENVQGWRLHNFSGQPDPILDSSHRETFINLSSLNLPVVSHLPTTHYCEESRSS